MFPIRKSPPVMPYRLPSTATHDSPPRPEAVTAGYATGSASTGLAAPGGVLGLSLTQVLGGALAAVTAALAASFLGVAGTIAGAAIGSLVATVGSAVYDHSLRTAGARLRIARVEPVARNASREPVAVQGPLREQVPGSRRPRRGVVHLAIGVIAGMVIALGGITAVEALIGHPLSSSTTGGTSISQAATGSTPTRSTKPSPAIPSTPSVTSTPSATATPPPSTTAPPPPSTAATSNPTGTSTAAPTSAAPSVSPSPTSSSPPGPAPTWARLGAPTASTPPVG